MRVEDTSRTPCDTRRQHTKFVLEYGETQLKVYSVDTSLGAMAYLQVYVQPVTIETTLPPSTCCGETFATTGCTMSP